MLDLIKFNKKISGVLLLLLMRPTPERKTKPQQVGTKLNRFEVVFDRRH